MTRAVRALLAAGILLMALVGAILLAASLIPEERVASMAAARAEAVLGERVRIGTAGVRLFPVPAVRLTGISIGGADDSTALAIVESADLRARILPLFRGRVVVSRLALDRPRILLAVDSAGRPNLPLLADEPADDGPQDAPGADGRARAGARDIAFQIGGIAVDGGTIGYSDARDGATLRLDGWDQRLDLSGRLQGGRLAAVVLRGWLQFDDVDADLPGAVLPARDLRLRLEHDAALELDRDRVVLRTLQLALNGVTLSGTGTLDSVSSPSARTAALELNADGLDATELMRWIPPALLDRIALPDGRRVELTGHAALRATLAGPLSVDSFPSLDGSLSGRGIGASAGSTALASGVRVTAAFAFDSVLARAQGDALGERFQLGIAARNPAAPSVVVAMSGRVDLGRLTTAGLVPDSLGLAGAVNADLRTQINVAEPASSRATGTIDLAGVRVAGFEPALRVPRATLRFDGGRVRAMPVRVELGPDRAGLDLELEADGWIPPLVDSAAPPPRITASLDADSLDLDALLRPSESEYPPLLFARLRDRPIDGRTAEALAAEAGLALPPLPPVEAEARVDIRRLIRNGLRYDDLEVLARASPTGISIERVRFGLMGGTVELSGRVEPVRTDSAGSATAVRVAGRYALAGVGARPFFDRLTPFRDHLSGDLDLVGTVGMTLDHHTLPDRGTVTADGTLAIADGALANWRVLDAVSDRLGLTAFDTLRFRDWAGTFRIAGPLVTLDETMLRGGDLDARAAGSFDLGGRLDLGVTAYLTRSLADRAGNVGRQVMAAAATDGRVPVGLRITGNVEDPDVALDLSEARAAAVERAQEAAREEARQAADRVAREVAQEVTERFELPDSLAGLPPDSLRAVLGDSLYGLVPDSLKMTADTLAERAEEAIRQRLRRLIPGGGGG